MVQDKRLVEALKIGIIKKVKEIRKTHMEINLAQTGFQEYLEKEEEVLAVYLFGSCSENLAHTRSDIDLAILLRPEVDKSQYTKYRLKYLQELKRFFPLCEAKQAAVGERLRQYDEYQGRQSFSKGQRNLKSWI